MTTNIQIFIIIIQIKNYYYLLTKYNIYLSKKIHNTTYKTYS